MIFQLVPLYGLTELMIDLVIRSEFIREILSFMQEQLLQAFQALEKEGRLTNNNEQFLPSGSVAFTDQLKAEKEQERYALKDLWGFADTQEFTDVSPEMWREFVLPYQKALLKEFGLVYYGCCEKMDAKFDDIMSIPGIRKISVSTWTDTRIVAEKIGNKAIYCRKVNPSPIIYGASREDVLKDVAQLLEIMRFTHKQYTTK